MMHLYFSDVFFLSVSCLIFLWMAYSFTQTTPVLVWIRICRQPLAMIAAAFLLFYWMIACLDCVHIQDVSILDRLFAPLNEFSEYSYSKPCHLKSFLPQVEKLGPDYMMSRHVLKYVPQNWTQTQAYTWMLHIALKMCISILLPYFSLVYYLRHRLQRLHSYQRNIVLFLSCLMVLIYVALVLYTWSRHLHVFGTNQVGYDVFYQTVKSIRTGLMISLMTTMFIVPFALSFGLMAGYFGSWIDYLIQFLYTVISSIPSVLLVSSGVLAWQMYAAVHLKTMSMYQLADQRLVLICILLGISSWSSLCRYIRAEVLKLREMDYIKMAWILKTPKWKILFRHLLPNTMHFIIINIVLDFSYLVLAESVLTYIGIGVSPLTQSWGNMINAARLQLAYEPAIWWPLMTAFSFMFFLVLSCNLFADACRKALNPKEL